jgi:hypothetical protein
MGLLIGQKNWTMARDNEGHRTYRTTWLIYANSLDGPHSILNTAGLPSIGAPWIFGNDNDPWAFCVPETDIRMSLEGEPNEFWELDQTFTTRPLKRCQDASIDNPLNEPYSISGSFVNERREAKFDRNGDLMKTSSHELIRGDVIERDYGNSNIIFSWNQLVLPLELATEYRNSLNDADLWGLEARKIKMSRFHFTRKLYGTCSFYYTTTYEFDIDFEGFDRSTYDQGTRVLAAGGDKDDPNDFVQAKDLLGENYNEVLLDGEGNALAKDADPVEITLELYDEKNLLMLGIPPTL